MSTSTLLYIKETFTFLRNFGYNPKIQHKTAIFYTTLLNHAANKIITPFLRYFNVYSIQKVNKHIFCIVTACFQITKRKTYNKLTWLHIMVMFCTTFVYCRNDTHSNLFNGTSKNTCSSVHEIRTYTNHLSKTVSSICFAACWSERLPIAWNV